MFLSSYYRISYGINSNENIEKCCVDRNQIKPYSPKNESVLICDSKLTNVTNLNTQPEMNNSIKLKDITTTDKWFLSGRSLELSVKTIEVIKEEIIVEKMFFKGIKKVSSWLINPPVFNPQVLVQVLLYDSNRMYYLGLKSIALGNTSDAEKYLLQAEDNMTLITRGISYYLKDGKMNSSSVYEIHDSLLLHEQLIIMIEK